MRGKAIGILALLSAISGAAVANAVSMWFNLGPGGTFTPYLIGNYFGEIPVYVYLFVSVVLATIFLSGASHRIVSELSYADQISAIDEEVNRLESALQFQHELLQGVQTRLFMVDESLEHSRKTFSTGLVKQGNTLRQSLNRSRESQRKMLDGVKEQICLIDKGLDNLRRGLNEQRGATKEIIGDFLESLRSKLAFIDDAVERHHKEMDNAFSQFEQKEKNSVMVIEEQKNELAEIVLKLEKLESSIFKPKPLLGSQSNIREVKGIGQIKATKLKEIGISNVSEFITAESKVVANGLGSSEKTVEKLQGRAQLSMVPGVKKKHLFLLERVNVRDRNSLYKYTPIELSKKINAVFEANIIKKRLSPLDKPTIEEVDSWVKFSRC